MSNANESIEPKYLSEAISSLEVFKKGCLNLIEAPVASGKTTFALKILPHLASRQDRIVYLIDTIAGRDQIICFNKNVQIYNKEWRQELVSGLINFEEDKIIIMTYALFGCLAKYHPSFLKEVELVICDELHNIFWMIPAAKKEMYWQDPSISLQNLEQASSQSEPQITKSTLENLCSQGNCYVVALTATPKRIYQNFKANINTIEPDCELVRLKDYSIHTYRNLEYELGKLEAGKKYMVYSSHIRAIKKFSRYLEEKGFRAVGIWSSHNEEHPMSKVQLDVREHIVQNQHIPDNVDILLYNKAFETSINIFGDIEAMYIHSSDEETIIQARGRFRQDLNHLYVFTQDTNDIGLPPEYIGVPLLKEDKVELAQVLNIRNKGNRLCMWPTIRKLLEAQGYIIKEKKEGNLHVHFIYEKPDKDLVECTTNTIDAHASQAYTASRN